MNKVLLVDDDPNILQAYTRRLRKQFDIDTALCSEEGETAVDILGPYAVIVSDMQMPRENGVEFLSKIMAKSPDSVRIMLSGNADQQTAIDAVNQGRVFFFLNKPCQSEDLEAAIQEAIVEHNRLKSLREQTEVNVRALLETLSTVCKAISPIVGVRQQRLQKSMRLFASLSRLDDSWEYQTIAIASQFGVNSVSDAVEKKVICQEKLTAQEETEWNRQFAIAANMIEGVPRLQLVSDVLHRLSGVQLQDDHGNAEEVSLIAELLDMAIHYDLGCYENCIDATEVIEEVCQASRYSEKAMKLIEQWATQQDTERLVEISVESLVDGMRVIKEIVAKTGTVLVTKGIEVCPVMRAKLEKYASTDQVALPIKARLAIGHEESPKAQLATV